MQGNGVVAAGSVHTCVVLPDATASCFGDDVFGQIGTAEFQIGSHLPTPVDGLTNVSSVSGGDRFSCAVTINGSVWCWGYNEHGQLGSGIPVSSESFLATKVAGVKNARAVSAGEDHACALLSTGKVKCWGDDSLKQTSGADKLPGDAISIAAGRFTTCAVTADGSVWCWGEADFGQTGDPTFPTLTAEPNRVGSINDATAVTVGNSHACALLSTGTVKCWGNDTFGQLGAGMIGVSNTAAPVTMKGVTSATVVSAGNSHTCVIAAGTPRCTGWNGSGQLGVPGVGETETALKMKGISNAHDISAGAFHTCVTTTKGRVRCTGLNDRGQLGDGDSFAKSPTLIDAFAVNGPGSLFLSTTKPRATCYGYRATKVGTNKANTITGTKGVDVIAGRGGNDTIKGLGGADLLCGGSGNDTLLGQGGKDVLLGGPGSDKLAGGSGADSLYGDDGNDSLEGGKGADRCVGGLGSDTKKSCEKN